MAQTALRERPGLRVATKKLRRTAVPALAMTLMGVFAATASATVRVVSTSKSGPNTYSTIQAAVNAATAGDWVLIEPGVYDEAVKVTSAQSGIWIRGMNRNTVIIDGQHRTGNGIEITKSDNVWVENLTVRNFDEGSGCPVEQCGNEIWRNGG